MYHKLAKIGANMCLHRQWISKSQLEWCVYALEKWINSLSTVFFFLLLSVPTEKCVQTFAFFLTFFSLRRRLGGWHAKHAWSCQAIGILLMLFVIYLLGPKLEVLDLQFIALMDVLVLLVGFIVTPIYPPQLNFTYSAVKHNKREKNFTLVIIIAFQILSVFVSTNFVILYSALGIFVSVIALVPEKINAKDPQ